MTDTRRPALHEGYRPVATPSAFADMVGPFYVFTKNDDRRCAFVADERHGNSSGVVHGGMLMAFADVAFSVIRRMDGDEASTSVTFTFEFVQPGHLSDLIEARMRVVRQTGSLNFIRGEVFVGDTILLTSSTVEKRLRQR